MSTVCLLIYPNHKVKEGLVDERTGSGWGSRRFSLRATNTAKLSGNQLLYGNNVHASCRIPSENSFLSFCGGIRGQSVSLAVRLCVFASKTVQMRARSVGRSSLQLPDRAAKHWNLIATVWPTLCKHTVTAGLSSSSSSLRSLGLILRRITRVLAQMRAPRTLWRGAAKSPQDARVKFG